MNVFFTRRLKRKKERKKKRLEKNTRSKALDSDE